MKRLNAAALLDESRKIVSLTVLAGLAAGAVILLDRVGGPLAAILGSISVGLAARLLYQAATRPDTPTRPETPANSNRSNNQGGNQVNSQQDNRRNNAGR